MVRERLRVLFVIAEAYPFIKVGGLGDVGASLPKALARSGHDAKLVLPGYARMGAGEPLLSFDVPMGTTTARATVAHHGKHRGVDVYAVGGEGYFDRGAVYGGYEDNDVAPFVFFSKAVVEWAALSGWRPDVLHCNDWHTGLVPQYLRRGRHGATFERARTVFTIHNLAYQGHFGPEAETLVGLDGEGSMLARGIVFADAVNTVSRRYLDEILTVRHGMGMDGLLRARDGDLRGILNGVDYEDFDPQNDPRIAARYDGSSLEGKRICKAALQRKSGLRGDPDVPLIGMVSRLVDQKGVDLLCAAVDEVAALGAQLVVMGRGDEHYERSLEAAAARHPDAISYHATPDEVLARQVYAGSDLFLAPSAFEPCGLGPLIALRYGSVPVVRRTGGLAETILDYDRQPSGGLGFTFTRRSSRHLVKAVGRALRAYGRKAEWQVLQRRGMSADFSWEGTVREYEGLYTRALSGSRATVPAVAEAAPAEAAPAEAGARREGGSRPVPLALVHHANQYLLTDGYDNREGIGELAEGYAAALRLHEKYGIPANLHISGTLIETLAWYSPWLLEMVKDLREKDLVFLIGGTYAENVMPVFPPSFNLRQLDEFLWLYEHHLGCPPEQVKFCWVPERVWDTSSLAPVLTSDRLENGGYRHVLLDDRLLYPTNGSYGESPRARFDSAGPYASVSAPVSASRNGHKRRSEDWLGPIEAHKIYKISGANGLTMVPMSANLRYWVPPLFPEHWRYLRKTVEWLAREGGDRTLLVYADDLENTAGIGGWDSSALGRYEAFLRWVSSREDIAPVRLDRWLSEHPAEEERALESGSFFELARDWRAGEDYSGWWEDPAWSCYKGHLTAARRAVLSAQRTGADGRLLKLAWKHLMASTYETAWHEDTDEGFGPAPWAKAVASHSRTCEVISDAARWFAR